MRRPLPSDLVENTVLPLIVAPMFLVSGPDLVIAACRAGVMAAFPAPNARTLEHFDQWLAQITGALDPKCDAPWIQNMVTHRSYQRLRDELDLVCKYKPRVVITALGSPAPILEAVHSYGGLVLADVNSIVLAQKAASAGVDGLVLIAAGAGGHTGHISGFAFVEAVRDFFDGILVLGGAISSGRAIRAAQILGADLAYSGTRFIATNESMAHDQYREMLVNSNVQDLMVTKAFTGANANMLIPSIKSQGLDPENLKPKTELDFNDPQGNMKAWKDIWSAGQGIGAVKKIQPVAEVVNDLRREYVQVVDEESAGNFWTRRSSFRTQ